VLKNACFCLSKFILFTISVRFSFVFQENANQVSPHSWQRRKTARKYRLSPLENVSSGETIGFASSQHDSALRLLDRFPNYTYFFHPFFLCRRRLKTSYLSPFQRVSLLTSQDQNLKPVFRRHKGTGVGLTVSTPAAVGLIEINNPSGNTIVSYETRCDLLFFCIIPELHNLSTLAGLSCL